MKYAVVKVVNGNFAISTEHGENLRAAKVAFYQLCSALESADDVITAEVKIMDENLDNTEQMKAYIYHGEPAPTEPTEG